MKKIFFISLFVSLAFTSFSQFYAGAHFAYNSTWLMNKQVFDEGPEMDIAVSFGNYFGVMAGYYFTDQLGVEININPNKIVQKYRGDFKLSGTDERAYYNSSTVLNTIDYPVLLKIGKDAYFELGCMFSSVSKASYNKTFDEDYFNNFNVAIYKDISYFDFYDIENMDVKAAFKTFGIGAIIGFGANINLYEDALKLNFGLRFNYIITDLQGINALGYTKDVRPWVSEKETKTFKTNPLYLGLKAGLIYEFN